MGRHPHRSSATAPPTVQTLRRIRALSDDRELHGNDDDDDDDDDCAREKYSFRKSASWEWDWDFSAEGKGVGLLGSGLELEIGAGLERIGGRIPGYKGTAAFLSTLRQNLALTTSLRPPDSPATTASTMSSPPSLHSSTTLPPPSPLSASPLTPPSSSPTSSSSSSSPSAAGTALAPASPPTSLPPLTTIPATTTAHKHAALRLLADALAQRRQLASALIIRSPPFLALAALALAVLVQTTYRGRASIPLIGTTFAGVAMALLLGVRWLAGGYLELAERVGWPWLGEDEVWVSLWGTDEQVVGAVVVRTEREGKRRRRGVVRGWTVRLRERGRGVGRGLLEEVGRVGRERGWDGVGMEEGGLYDEKVLPMMFHREFERRSERGRTMLEEVWVEQGGRKRSR
ncbi:hypothetical protein MMC11_001624 [Xylographa trunciseda]|nr:hypothetical protein [Xylographa trunciseda]